MSGGAIEVLCQRYWGPLYGFGLRRGCTEHDAQDLTQAFFADFLAKDYLKAADRSRGRLRTFLLTAFQHFMIRRWRWERRKKRWGGDLPIDQEVARPQTRPAEPSEPVAPGTPTEEYDRQWGIAVLDAGFQNLRNEYRAEGRLAAFEALKPFLSRVAETGDYETAALVLGISTGAVAVAVHRLRKRYSERVLMEVMGTVADPEDARDELRYLVGLVASR